MKGDLVIGLILSYKPNNWQNEINAIGLKYWSKKVDTRPNLEKRIFPNRLIYLT